MASEAREKNTAGEKFFDFSEVFYRFGEAIFNKLRIKIYKYCDAFLAFLLIQITNKCSSAPFRKLWTSSTYIHNGISIIKKGRRSHSEQKQSRIQGFWLTFLSPLPPFLDDEKFDRIQLVLSQTCEEKIKQNFIFSASQLIDQTFTLLHRKI